MPAATIAQRIVRARSGPSRSKGSGLRDPTRGDEASGRVVGGQSIIIDGLRRSERRRLASVLSFTTKLFACAPCSAIAQHETEVHGLVALRWS